MHTDTHPILFYGLCLRRNRLRLLAYSSRHNILCICLFAREDVTDSLKQVCFNGMVFGFLFGVLLYAKTDFGVHMRPND